MSKAASTSPIEKGKSKAPPTPPGSNSDSHTPSWTKRDKQEARYEARLNRIMANMTNEAPIPIRTRQGNPRRQYNTSYAPPPPPVNPLEATEEGENEEDLLVAPLEYLAVELDDSKKFKTHFAKRKICKMFYVNFQVLLETLKLDLFPYLGQYMPWLFVNLPYCLKVVRHFYCFLEPVEECSKGRLVIEDELETTVRGRKFLISPSRINKWLRDRKATKGPPTKFNQRQMYRILRLG